MSTEIRVPTLGESVTEATVGQWYKKPGEAVNMDEPIVELETDKVTVEVPSPVAGVMSDISVDEGGTVEVGALLGSIAEGEGASAGAQTKEEAKSPAKEATSPVEEKVPAANDDMPPSPSAAKMAKENAIDTTALNGSGKRGQVLKGDVLAALDNTAKAPAPTPAAKRVPSKEGDVAREERVRMTKLRQTIARRLKDAQATAAMLTTFNDVDMSAVMQLRKDYKELFEKKHGVKLGFMGLFIKACIQALKDVPEVNAEIDGNDIIYKNYYHVAVAVGTEKGLVVPVVRDADEMSIAEIEKNIGDFGARARKGALGIDEMQGGTFTISNGGIYGSLMSTPILNAPQSGILGMHRIEQRPIAINGEVVVRPMMYLALSYDHRVVDGKGAVTFLVRVKEALEDPQRLVLDL